jgi:hypothetical protein
MILLLVPLFALAGGLIGLALWARARGRTAVMRTAGVLAFLAGVACAVLIISAATFKVEF